MTAGTGPVRFLPSPLQFGHHSLLCLLRELLENKLILTRNFGFVPSEVCQMGLG